MAHKIFIDRRWEGEECFIIGGGPSLREIPNLEELLIDKNVIGCNDAYRFACTDTCIFTDRNWYMSYKDRRDFKEFKGTFLSVDTDSKLFGDDVSYVTAKARGISIDPDAIAVNTNTGAAAINLAILYGCTTIYLVGFDMKVADDNETNWHKNITSTPPERYKYFQTRFKVLKTAIEDKCPEVDVINCNLNSALDIWPKVDLHKILGTHKTKIITEPVILTVLKTGGEYSVDHVKALKKQIEEHTTIPYQFMCLTDENIPGEEIIPLTDELGGWHSKLELFKHLFYGPATFLDLDTIVRGNIDHILDHDLSFGGLNDFYKPKNFASGIMQWDGDYSRMWNNNFAPQLRELQMSNWKKVWDQKLIEDSLTDNNIEWQSIQKAYPGQILSWKADELQKEIPKDCRIICFHGKPRPWNVPQFKYLYEVLVECPHCKKKVSPATAKRKHGDNCKERVYG